MCPKLLCSPYFDGFPKKIQKNPKNISVKRNKIEIIDTSSLFTGRKTQISYGDLLFFHLELYLWKILHNFLINHSTLIYIIYLHIFFFYIKSLFSQPRRKERAGQFKLCKNRYFFHSSKCILCIHYEAKKSCDRF